MGDTRNNPWRTFVVPVLLIAAFSLSAYGQSFKVNPLGHRRAASQYRSVRSDNLVSVGEEKLLLDCGRGTTQPLKQLNVGFPEVTALFLTHLHSDHVVGIPDF
jgi:ribonuclease Z